MASRIPLDNTGNDTGNDTGDDTGDDTGTRPDGAAKPRIVELFGLPGAGKTTITQGLPPETTSGTMTSREQISERWQRQPFLRRAATAARILPDFAWMRSVFALAIHTPLTKTESLARLARLAVTKPWLRSQQGDLLFDQGLLQRLWSIFYTEGVTAPPHKALTRLLRQYYGGMDVQIVMIDVQPELAAERVHGRAIGSSRLDELPEIAVRTELRNTAGLPAALLAAAREAGLSVTTLDGSAQPHELVAELQAIIRAKAAQEQA